LNSLQKKAWEISENPETERKRRFKLYRWQKSVKNKLELLTDATVVDDAIRFVSERSKEKLKLYSANSSEDQPEDLRVY
jgi:hypothetical protein